MQKQMQKQKHKRGGLSFQEVLATGKCWREVKWIRDKEMTTKSGNWNITKDLDIELHALGVGGHQNEMG